MNPLLVILYIFDTDKDECLNPTEIAQMLRIVEKIIAKNNCTSLKNSAILLQHYSDSIAEIKFVYLMTNLIKKVPDKLNLYEGDRLITFEG
jgi:hypothetical protein